MKECMNPKAIILMGLPCAGKTTWIKEKGLSQYKIISADDLKESHPDYNPNSTQALHEWSVQEAENLVDYAIVQKQDFVFDSGSINNSYTVRIINKLKAASYYVELVHVKTPYPVCLERNKLRERKVPEYAITDKAIIENKQYNRLKNLVDVTIVVDYFTNKYMFFDMDGVLAAQSTLPIVNGCIDFVNGEIFKHQQPVMPVIGKLQHLQNKFKIVPYILSAAPNSIAIDEKHGWLDEYCNIPRANRFFVNQGRHKAEMLDNVRRMLKFDPKDVTLIDDIHDILYKVKERGMNAMHISEFLVW